MAACSEPGEAVEPSWKWDVREVVILPLASLSVLSPVLFVPVGLVLIAWRVLVPIPWNTGSVEKCGCDRVRLCPASGAQQVLRTIPVPGTPSCHASPNLSQLSV